MYSLGQGVEKDPARAHELIRKAADLREPAAMLQLAMMYERGAGVDADAQQAQLWMSRAMQSYLQLGAWGHVDSMKHLGWIYSAPRPNLSADLPRAVEWYRKAAEAGDPEAMRALADAYRRGEGVERDEEQAQAWMDKAEAAMGSP
jgi:TPR repeat protein